jgi:hypothetical protein
MKLKVKEFYPDSVDLATKLEECQEEGYEACTVPMIVDALGGTPSTRTEYATLSMLATGKTKKGSAVDIFIHRNDHYFSDPENIRRAVDNLSITFNGGGLLPPGEIDRYVSQEDGKNVIVMNHQKFMSSSSSNYITVDEALSSPFVLSFFGEREIAEIFLRDLKGKFNDKEIGVFHKNHLGDKPAGYLLDIRCRFYKCVLSSECSIQATDRNIIGIQRKKANPELEDILTIIDNGRLSKKQQIEAIRKLYNPQEEELETPIRL